ncbi:hypothetical protein ABPG72_008797 [Tetrahymena utriculariae]
MQKLNIGVLCLQGGFIEHFDYFNKISNQVNVVDVRYADQLDSLHALVIPGGESTVQGILLEKYNMLPALKQFILTKPVWGICAGAIILAEKLANTAILGAQELQQFSQPLIGGLKVTMNRNYFGRQIDSAVRKFTLTERAKTFGLSDVSHFIRAPAITQVDSSKVDVLATLEEQGKSPVIVAVQQSNILATVFHPEITQDDYTWHSYFLNMIRENFVKIERPTHLESLYKVKEGVPVKHSWSIKTAMLKYLKGGVIMDVVNPVQAKIAEAAGACAVMALEKIPADIKADGGIARSSDPKMITEVMDAVSIPVMAKARIGHFGEAQILEALGVDCIDESEVLTAADCENHIHKHPFKVPFVCGAKNLGEALRRISEGAAMIRMKGDAGTGNVVNAVQHTRTIFREIKRLQYMREDELYVFAKDNQVSIDLVKEVRQLGRLPVVTFAAGGIATPADTILLMELGVDGVFVGSGIFKSSDPDVRARAMVTACSFYRNKLLVAHVSSGLGKPMVGILSKGETYAYGNIDAKL